MGWAGFAPPPAIAVRAPMKLVVAGEYAVLEPGNVGIVAAVSRHATCTAREHAEGVEISAPTLGPGSIRTGGPIRTGELRFEPIPAEGAPKFVFARTAAELGYRYVAELGLRPRALALTCESDGGQTVLAGTGERAKLGLGTSAATSVAVIGAVLAAHGVAVDRPAYRRHALRLALVAHARAQGGRGSGIDVVASAHGGLVEYGRPDGSWLKRIERAAGGGTGPGMPPPALTALQIARGPWPGLHVDPLPIPHGMRLLAGFTGAPVATGDAIAKIEAWRRDHAPEHDTFVRLSQRSTRGLAAALRKGDRGEVIANVALSRKALVYLGSHAGVAIETPALERLAAIAFDAGGAGKVSGAGGGDCGIAFAFDEGSARKIEEAWRAAGIAPIPLGIAPAGLQEVPPAPVS